MLFKMKVIKLFFLLIGLVNVLSAQNVNSAEYYWDNDPGVGNGTQLSFPSPSVDVNGSFNVSTIGLSQGIHVLGVRTKNDAGMWSTTNKMEVNVHRFSEIEYFWDSDLGTGNGQSIIINSTQSDLITNASISTQDVMEGNHVLHFRVKGVGNSWSVFQSIPVRIENKIVAAEYYWNHDPGVGNGTSLSVNSPSEDLLLNADISTTGLDTTLDIHYLVVRTLGANDSWSVALDTALFLGPVDIEDLKVNNTHISLFPNPTSESIHLVMFSALKEEVMVRLLHHDGQLIETIHQGPLTERLSLSHDVTHLASGNYLIEISNGATRRVEKIAIIH
jgi:hypothetical protein